VILIAIGILSFLWGSSFIPIKNIVDVINPLSAFGLRFVISGLSLISVHYFLNIISDYRSGKKGPKSTTIRKNTGNKKEKRILKSWILSGLFFIVGGQGLLAWGAQYLSSGATALINSTIPIWIAVMALLFFKTIPAKFTIAGIAAGFTGLIILILPTIDEGESIWIGIVFLIFSSVSWALGSLYSKPIGEVSTKKKGILLSTGMFMSIGGILLIIVAMSTGSLISSDLDTIFKPTNDLLISFIYLTLVCTAIGYTIFYWLLETTTPSLANTFAYIVPVVAVFLGWILLDESITASTIIATGIISGGVAL
jgi:drug/metabolite transporter (DMT)-like permease